MLLTYFSRLPSTGTLSHKGGEGKQLMVKGQAGLHQGKGLEGTEGTSLV